MGKPSLAMMRSPSTGEESNSLHSPAQFRMPMSPNIGMPSSPIPRMPSSPVPFPRMPLSPAGSESSVGSRVSTVSQTWGNFGQTDTESGAFSPQGICSPASNHSIKPRFRCPVARETEGALSHCEVEAGNAEEVLDHVYRKHLDAVLDTDTTYRCFHCDDIAEYSRHHTFITHLQDNHSVKICSALGILGEQVKVRINQVQGTNDSMKLQYEKTIRRLQKEKKCDQLMIANQKKTIKRLKRTNKRAVKELARAQSSVCSLLGSQDLSENEDKSDNDEAETIKLEDTDTEEVEILQESF